MKFLKMLIALERNLIICLWWSLWVDEWNSEWHGNKQSSICMIVEWKKILKEWEREEGERRKRRRAVEKKLDKKEVGREGNSEEAHTKQK